MKFNFEVVLWVISLWTESSIKSIFRRKMFGQATSLESYISLYVLPLLKFSYLRAFLCHCLTHHSVLVVKIITGTQLSPKKSLLWCLLCFLPISLSWNLENFSWMRLELFWALLNVLGNFIFRRKFLYLPQKYRIKRFVLERHYSCCGVAAYILDCVCSCLSLTLHLRSC